MNIKLMRKYQSYWLSDVYFLQNHYFYFLFFVGTIVHVV